MPKILIIYYSKTGNTKKMAEMIYEGVTSVKDIDVEIKSVEEVNVDELLNADGIIVDIIKAMLIHGMIVYGDPVKDHYGPVAVTTPDDRATKGCIRLGQRVAGLVKKLKG